MFISVFDLFKIGIGPSSSHTVGPMIAAQRFASRLHETGRLAGVRAVKVELFGSLSATGRGHGTDTAVLLGLQGHLPDQIDPETIPTELATLRQEQTLRLLGQHRVPFQEKTGLIFHRRELLPLHSNGLRFSALDDAGALIQKKEYYSIGGGFVINCRGQRVVGGGPEVPFIDQVPLPFHSGAELLARCREAGTGIAGVMLRNECSQRPQAEVRAGLLRLWQAMSAAVERGCVQTGELPGPMRVRRRAPALHRTLSQQLASGAAPDPLALLDWVNLFAMAVNEENAAGGRIVTAPTNGAAGVIPAVLHYYVRFVAGASDAGIVDFLLTAGAIGALYKENASISGAEVGCQGEVGVACSMAAGALCAVLGGTPDQVENAAEIGMEHNLGMTCDPVGGQVQIPCIERNAMGAIKAINAARMALQGDGQHVVSLDQVIKTMMQTGRDMKVKYKETSRGGLAVNIIEC
ncbi:L-serine ammonia-lyase [Amphibiibacter pelophylacis]|uniref:L-serine ammonia-lyase n=1 Tax=Amphibiibacter pelophylacis TaxID=1799477 RepID=A0ACC6P3I9_9BURK